MTRASSLSPLVVKEVRALLPLTAATLLTLAAALVAQHRSYADIGLIGYVAGVVALGAHAIGHEYAHRTLPMLLAQPATRRRLLAVKFAVAAAMLAALAVAAAAVFASDGFRGNDAVRAIILPMLAAIFITPLFTIMCRNTLAGAILGVSSPLTLWVIVVLAAWWGFGVDGDTVTAWLLDRWPGLAVVACPVLGALTWRAFNRIEALDGSPAPLTLPRWIRGTAGVRRRAPWRALVAKEIHLQQMTIAITFLYGVIWALGVGWRQTAPQAVVLPLEAVLLLYCLGLAIVIGALASAEERQHGTLDVQLLQPVAARRQWAVKCAVALALALLLGAVVPALLMSSTARISELSSVRDGVGKIAVLVVLLTSASLYISSMAGSGVKAMAWSLPVGIAVAIFIQTSQAAIVRVSGQLGSPLPVDRTEALLVSSHLFTLFVVPALLWFGFVNHTSADRSFRRTLQQIGTLAMLVVAGIVVGGVLI